MSDILKWVIWQKEYKVFNIQKVSSSDFSETTLPRSDFCQNLLFPIAFSHASRTNIVCLFEVQYFEKPFKLLTVAESALTFTPTRQNILHFCRKIIPFIVFLMNEPENICILALKNGLSLPTGR